MKLVTDQERQGQPCRGPCLIEEREPMCAACALTFWLPEEEERAAMDRPERSEAA